MVGNSQQIIQWLFQQNDLAKKFEIKEYKGKRSLSQNSYAWVLINEIANVVRKSKEEVYFEMLKAYGQSQIVSILSTIDPQGYFKYYEKIGTGIVNNKEFTHYKIFKGSSEMDTKEMSILLDGIIEEAKNLNIETITPAELAKLRQMEYEIERRKK